MVTDELDSSATPTRDSHPAVTVEGRDFLIRQFAEIKRSTSWRLASYSLALFAIIVGLFSLISMSFSTHDTVKKLDSSAEDFFFTRYALLLRDEEVIKDSQTILAPRTVERVNEYIRKLERNAGRDELIKELWFAGISHEPSTPTLAISTHLAVHNGYQIQRQEGLDAFFSFNIGNPLLVGVPRLEYAMGKMPELDKQIRKLYRLSPSQPITHQHLIQNEAFAIWLSAMLSDEYIAQINQARKQMAQDMKERLEQNIRAFDDLKRQKADLRKTHDEKLVSLIEAPTTQEQYARLIHRASISIILITAALTVLILIRNEVTMFAKLQSLIVMAGGMNFNVKNISLFDALERLHGYKGLSGDAKEVLALYSTLKKVH